jgi:hypothetical protein
MRLTIENFTQIGNTMRVLEWGAVWQEGLMFPVFNEKLGLLFILHEVIRDIDIEEFDQSQGFHNFAMLHNYWSFELMHWLLF